MPTISLTSLNKHKGANMDTDTNWVNMKRLNPWNKDGEIMGNLFPSPNNIDNTYNTIKGETFKQFLMCDSTTEEGQNAIARHYGVLDEWNTLNHEGDFINKYYKLLLLVNTES